MRKPLFDFSISRQLFFFFVTQLRILFVATCVCVCRVVYFRTGSLCECVLDWREKLFLISQFPVNWFFFFVTQLRIWFVAMSVCMCHVVYFKSGSLCECVLDGWFLFGDEKFVSGVGQSCCSHSRDDPHLIQSERVPSAQQPQHAGFRFRTTHYSLPRPLIWVSRVSRRWREEVIEL